MMKSTTLLSLSLGLMLGAPALAQTYTISQSTIGSSVGGGCTGGTFTSNVGITPVPSPVPSTIPLQTVTFYRGGLGANNANVATYLNIYDGDPSGSGVFVGSSTNAVDTTVATLGGAYVWDFGGLSLNYTQKYWAVMSSSNTGVGSPAIGVSLYGTGADSYPGGEVLQANYVPHPSANDLKFDIVLGTPLPTIDQLTFDNSIGPGGTGQTFTPNVGILPVPSPAPSTIPLRQVTFYRGTLGANNANVATYLNVYDGQPGAGGTFIGSSTNTVDTTVATFGLAYVWDFADLPLNYTQKYWLVMSDSNTGVGLTAIGVSLYTHRSDPYSGGDVLKAGYAVNPPADLMFSIVFSGNTDGTFTYAGNTPGGCPSPAGQAQLSAATAPNIGNAAFAVDMAPIPPSLPYLFVGFSDTVWSAASLPLPVPISLFSSWAAPSCAVVVDPLTSPSMAVSGSSASWAFPLPNWASLVGLKLYVQGIGLYPGPNMYTTGKGTIVIGQ